MVALQADSWTILQLPTQICAKYFCFSSNLNDTKHSENIQPFSLFWRLERAESNCTQPQKRNSWKDDAAHMSAACMPYTGKWAHFCDKRKLFLWARCAQHAPLARGDYVASADICSSSRDRSFLNTEKRKGEPLLTRWFFFVPCAWKTRGQTAAQTQFLSPINHHCAERALPELSALCFERLPSLDAAAAIKYCCSKGQPSMAL